MKLSVEQCSRSDAHGHLEENHTDIARKHRISDDLRPNCQLGSNARTLLGIFNIQRHQLCIYNKHLYLLHISSRIKLPKSFRDTISLQPHRSSKVTANGFHTSKHPKHGRREKTERSLSMYSRQNVEHCSSHKFR